MGMGMGNALREPSGMAACVMRQMTERFAYTIVERSGLRQLSAEKRKARQAADRCDRGNAGRVWRRRGPNPKVGNGQDIGRSSAKAGRLHAAITCRSLLISPVVRISRLVSRSGGGP